MSYDKEATLISEAVELTAKVLAKATPGVGELTDFAAKLLQTGLAAKPVMNDGSNRSYSPDEVKELIRRGAQVRPLVLLIDDLDQARDHWLLDLLREMAPEIDRMRLMLAATLEGSSELGEYNDSEPEVITRVRGLMEANVEERLAMRATGHKNIETHAIYTNIDRRLAKVIAESLDRLHAEREKADPQDITDGTGFLN